MALPIRHGQRCDRVGEILHLRATQNVARDLRVPRSRHEGGRERGADARTRSRSPTQHTVTSSSRPILRRTVHVPLSVLPLPAPLSLSLSSFVLCVHEPNNTSTIILQTSAVARPRINACRHATNGAGWCASAAASSLSATKKSCRKDRRSTPAAATASATAHGICHSDHIRQGGLPPCYKGGRIIQGMARVQTKRGCRCR